MADMARVLETDEFGRRIYEPDGKVLRDYLFDRRHVSVIRGPIGSGTSSASCYKLALIASEQRPGPDGVRRTRWAVVRNTYSELRDTTLATWLFWFPEEIYGTLVRSRPMIHRLKWADVEMEVHFIALDNEDDVKKLRSTEYTGFWFNEIEFTPKSIFDEAESRTGRYPPAGLGGPTWDGVLGDMNAPSEDNWLVQMTGESPYPDEAPEDARVRWPDGTHSPDHETGEMPNWGYHIQPPAVLEVFGADGKTVTGYVENPLAENRGWLKVGYYREKMVGKSRQWILSRLMNRITFFVEGDPVWPNFKPEVHVAAGSLPYVAGREVIVALDFGRRPCAIIAQEIGDRIQVQREFRMYGVSSAIFAPALKRFLEKNYRGAKVVFVGDPKGRDRGQATEASSYEIFSGYGMPVVPAPVRNNNLDERLEAVSYALQENRILIAIDCLTLRAACAGKYHLVKMDVGEPEPKKDKYSDAGDCLQYLCLYLGEGRRMYGLEAIGAGSAKRAQIGGKGPRSLRRIA